MKTNPTLLKAVLSVAGMTVFAFLSGARADGAADRAAFLEVHNTARVSVGVASLTWSDSLVAGAQAWANQLAARDGPPKHSPQPRPEGENIFSGSDGFTPADAAKSWLSEKESYTGGVITMENFASIGHYTQMVWSGTTEVGYGFAKSASGNVYVVARYSPAGNALDEKPYKEQATAAQQQATPEAAAPEQAVQEPAVDEAADAARMQADEDARRILNAKEKADAAARQAAQEQAAEQPASAPSPDADASPDGE